ncbi:MAG: hypothetical protein ABIY52_02290 [Gemmatimonadaceae bacterium]
MRRLPLALGAMIFAAASGCSSLPIVSRAPTERWGFTAPWDPRSAASVSVNAGRLDAIVSGWIALDSVTGLPLDLYRDSLVHSARRMALVTSCHGARFHPELLRRLAMDSLALKQVAGAIGDRLQRDGYRGAVIDLEGMTSADTALTRAVVATMADNMRRRGVGPVVVAVPASDTAGYPARLFETSADLLLVMLYDEHWATSPPGAIADPGWVRRSLATRVAEVGASRLVASLPLYGYVWRMNGAPAAAISFDDARRLATEAGVALERDPATQTLRAMRTDGDRWELWVSDAALLTVLEREVSAMNVRRVAYWRLGLEDAGVWLR